MLDNIERMPILECDLNLLMSFVSFQFVVVVLAVGQW